MKFVYGTDFHGDEEKYRDILSYAIEHNIKLIHLGADILPKGSNMPKRQKVFVKGYLKRFYDSCNSHGIKVLASFGNDDLYTRKRFFTPYADLLDEEPYRRNSYKFKAYPFVPDHCFALKNGVKLDNKDSKPEVLRKITVPMSYGGELVNIPVTPKYRDSYYGGIGFLEILDIDEYFKNKGTIEKDLQGIRVGSKTIMAIHSPPSGLNLDVCGIFRKRGKPKPGDRVGSDSVLKWIAKKQPLLILCGHIHENFLVTGVWKAMVGRTTVIQPGQDFTWKNGLKKTTVIVEIDITDCKVNAKRIEIN